MNMIVAIVSLLVYLITLESSGLICQELLRHYTKPTLMSWIGFCCNSIFFPLLYWHPPTRKDIKDALLTAILNFAGDVTYIIALHGTIAVVR